MENFGVFEGIFLFKGLNEKEEVSERVKVLLKIFYLI